MHLVNVRLYEYYMFHPMNYYTKVNMEQVTTTQIFLVVGLHQRAYHIRYAHIELIHYLDNINVKQT